MTTWLAVWLALGPELLGVRSRGIARFGSAFGRYALSALSGFPQHEHNDENWSCNEQDFIPTTLVSKHPRIVED